MNPRRWCLAGAAVLLYGLVTACSERAQAPLATSVCELASHAQQLARVSADISVESGGRVVIGDAHCDAIRVELGLAAAAARAGLGDRLRAASKRAADAGQTRIPAQITGVYAISSSGPYFTAEAIAIRAP